MKYSLDQKIGTLNFDMRTMNALLSANIKTVADFISYPFNRFLDIDGIHIATEGEILKKRIEILFYFAENGETAPGYKKRPKEGEWRRAVARDLPLVSLGVSFRTADFLSRAKINGTKALAPLEWDDLTAMPTIGSRIAYEALEAVTKLRYTYVEADIPDSGIDSLNEHLYPYALDLVKFLGLDEKLAVYAVNESSKGSDEDLIQALYGQNIAALALEETILDITAGLEGKTIEDVYASLPEYLKHTGIVDGAVKSLLNQKLLSLSETGRLKCRLPGVLDAINALENKAQKEYMLLRLQGLSGEEIASKYGITRAGVHRVIKEALRHIGEVEENKYLDLFCRYDISRDGFTRAFGEPDSTYYYLYTLRGKGKSSALEPIEKALADESLSKDIRKCLERAVYTVNPNADVKRSTRTSRDIMRLVAEAKCKEKTSIDEFISLYDNQLRELALDKDSKLTLSSRTVSNSFMMTCRYVLYSGGGIFRYYNFDDYNLDAFIGAIDFSKYEDLVISSLLIFRDYPELMQKYDISDEFELHNLLKKLLGSRADIEFTKMPIIRFGKGDVVSQIKDIISDNPSLTYKKICEIINEKYGISESNAKRLINENFPAQKKPGNV